MMLSSLLTLNSPAIPSAFDAKAKQFLKYIGSEEKIAGNAFKEVYDIPAIIGIEVEVENINKELSLPFFWSQEQDGSLRKYGKEFKSLPLSPQQAFQALAILWSVLDSQKADFSWRTSIHFHINVLNMEEDEFKRFILLSMLFEQLFFKLVGEDREQSNYCVPLCRSTVFDQIQKYTMGKQTIGQFFKHWNNDTGLYKYAAINFSRLGDLGTAEFRHLGGTNKLPLVFMLLAMTLQLYRTAITHTTEEVQQWILFLNSSKKYDELMKEVFGVKLSKAISYEKELLSGTVTRLKEMLVKFPKFDGVTPESAVASYGEVVHKRRQGKPKEEPKLKKSSGTQTSK